MDLVLSLTTDKQIILIDTEQKSLIIGAELAESLVYIVDSVGALPVELHLDEEHQRYGCCKGCNTSHHHTQMGRLGAHIIAFHLFPNVLLKSFEESVRSGVRIMLTCFIKIEIYVHNYLLFLVIFVHVFDDLLFGDMEVHLCGRRSRSRHFCYLLIAEFVIIPEIENYLLLGWQG